MYISPNSVSTLTGSYGKCKGRCFIRVLHLRRGIFPVNSCIQRLFWDVQVHFDCAGSHKTVVVVLGRGLFLEIPWEFSRKMALVTCPWPCRLRRLAQNMRLTFVAGHSACKFPHKMSLRRSGSQNRSLHDLAQLLTRRSCGDPGEILPCTDPSEKILWRSFWNHLRGPCMILYRSFLEDLVETLFQSSLRGLALRSWSLTEDLVEILVRSSLTGPCVKILQMPCLTVACMGALVDGSRKVLVSSSSSSKSFYDDLVRISLGSWHEDLGLGLLYVRSCGDPLEMLSGAFASSCTGLCAEFLQRSWWIL